MNASEPNPPLAAPRVRFAAGFAARCEAFAARLGARLGRRDEFGHGAHDGVGHDVVGHRAYVPGDDPRLLDAAASARSDRPLVRVTRREGGERWAIVIDASASMGVGPPGKLQLAAEIAAGLAAAARRLGAHAILHAVARPRDAAHAPRRVLEVGPRTRPSDVHAFLEGLEAGGVFAAGDLAALARAEPNAARLVILSDALSLRPTDVAGLAHARRRVALVRVLAPHELGRFADESDAEAAIEWVEPEQGTRAPVVLDAATRARYEALLGRELETWRVALARARVRQIVCASDDAFEDVAERAWTG